MSRRPSGGGGGGGFETQIGVDGAGGVAFVKGVEVDTVDFGIEEFGALLGGVVDADLFDGLGVTLGTIEGAEQFGGEAGAGGEFRHAIHA